MSGERSNMNNFKYFLICCIRQILKLFWLRKVNDREVVFCSYVGRNISCNPMYICRYMLQNLDGAYKYIWIVNDRADVYIPEAMKGKIELITSKSFAYFKYILSAKLVIYNMGLPCGSLLPKRASQTYVNTWHGGGAYKRAGKDASLNELQDKIDRYGGSIIDFFLSSNKKFSDIMSSAQQVKSEKFLEVGMPRNDKLVNGNLTELYKKIREYYNLGCRDKIVLFAPTYRGDFNTASFNMELDYVRLKAALQKRFGGNWIGMERMPHAVQGREHTGVINAGDYPDMQELLAAIDVLITDFSSSMWDYALTKKAGFLFTPDIEAYKEERNFYTPVETWPYPAAKSMEELTDCIQSFDESRNIEKIEKHFHLLGNCETGEASFRLLRKLGYIK